MIKTKVYVIVVHRATGKAFTYNEDWEILEPLILQYPTFSFESCRCFWKPMTVVPAWAMGIRDTMFDTYWLR